MSYNNANENFHDKAGGFFLAYEDLGGRFYESFPASAFFFFLWR